MCNAAAALLLLGRYNKIGRGVDTVFYWIHVWPDARPVGPTGDAITQ